MAIALPGVAVDGAAAREGVRAELGNIAAMDGLRGLSVAWIVLFHYAVLREGASDPWAALVRQVTGIAHGRHAVDLFFAISGFLLTLPWQVRAMAGKPAPDTWAFYRRRVLRIVPAYYVQLVVLFAIVMPLLHGVAYWRSDLYVYAGNAVAHGLFLHNLSPLTAGSMGANGALWTLAVEAQFYLLLPLLAPCFVRAPWRGLLLAALLSIGWVAGARHGFDALVAWHLELGRHWHWTEPTVRRLLETQLPAYLADFAVGAALGHAWLRRDRMPPWMRRLAMAAAAPFSRGPLAWLGAISYSAYLWHLPLLLVLQARAGITPQVFFPVYVAVLIAIAWASWLGLERPFMQARERASAARPRAP